MLRGIPTQISSDLLKALHDMGHSDTIVIADDFYPRYSKSPDAISISAKGNSAAEMIDAILTLMPLDVDYCEHPFLHMVPDADSGITVDNTKAWDDAEAAVIKHGYSKDCIGTIERTKFYEKAKTAVITLSTSEQLPFGCFILQKGVK